MPLCVCVCVCMVLGVHEYICICNCTERNCIFIHFQVYDPVIRNGINMIFIKIKLFVVVNSIMSICIKFFVFICTNDSNVNTIVTPHFDCLLFKFRFYAQCLFILNIIHEISLVFFLTVSRFFSVQYIYYINHIVYYYYNYYYFIISVCIYNALMKSILRFINSAYIHSAI